MVCPNERVIKHVIKQESFSKFVNGGNMDKGLRNWNHEIV